MHKLGAGLADLRSQPFFLLQAAAAAAAAVEWEAMEELPEIPVTALLDVRAVAAVVYLAMEGILRFSREHSQTRVPAEVGFLEMEGIHLICQVTLTVAELAEEAAALCRVVEVKMESGVELAQLVYLAELEGLDFYLPVAWQEVHLLTWSHRKRPFLVETELP
jgi:hypothetical protein